MQHSIEIHKTFQKTEKKHLKQMFKFMVKMSLQVL